VAAYEDHGADQEVNMKIITDIRYGGLYKGKFALLNKPVEIQMGKGMIALKLGGHDAVMVLVNPDNPSEIIAYVRDKSGQVVMLPIGDMEDR